MNQAQNKIRVAIVIGQTGFGGAERQLLYFIKHSDKERFEYHIIVLNSRKPHTYDNALREQGATVWQVPSNCRKFPRRIWYLSRLLRRIRPLVAHSWSFYANPYVGIAGYLTGIPVRLGSLRNDPDAESIRKAPPFLRWLAYHSVMGIVVNTRRAAEKLTGRGLSLGQVHIVFNGYDFIEQVAPDCDLSVYGIGTEHRVVATVGNLQKCKNHRMFINLMSQIVHNYPDSRGLIIGRELPGEPHIRKQLEAYIIEQGLPDYVHLAGFRDDVPRLMSRFDVFCLTSYSEGMPNVVLEAMAAARPVIATRVGDLPYIIKDGQNGFLVDIDDSDHMARIVQQLLEDQTLAARIGSAARETVQARFSCMRMAHDMETVYLETLAQTNTLNRR